MNDILNAYILGAPVATIIFFITILLSIICFLNNKWMLDLSFHPYSTIRGKSIWGIVTSGLVHANVPHLLFNMITFFYFVFPLELKFLGHWKFAVLYLSAIIISDIPTLLKERNNENYFSLGASGAVSAALFSYCLYNPLNKLYIMFIPIGIPAFIFAPLFIIGSILLSLRKSSHINHLAHIAGAVWGIIITIILDPASIGQFLSYFT